jgi:L-fuconolactonase
VGITATVVVQAADSEAETAFMLDVARLGRAGAGRGRLDLTRRPGAPARIAELTRIPLLKGCARCWTSTTPAGSSRCSRRSGDALRHGLRFDALEIPPSSVIGTLAERHPDLPVVMDHAASGHRQRQLSAVGASHRPPRPRDRGAARSRVSSPRRGRTGRSTISPVDHCWRRSGQTG